MLPSPNDIAGTRFLMRGKTEKERAERFRIILNEPDIVRVDFPTGADTPRRMTARDAQGNVVFDQVVNIYNPIVYDALERIEGNDIEIVKEGDIPFIGTRSFLELKSISENLSRRHIDMADDRAVNGRPGTVYFELYQQSNNGYNAGSLLQWYFPPDLVNEDGQIEVNDRKAKHVSPHYVLFLLFADAMEDKGKEYYPPEELPAYPVATIAFKWDELKTRLNEITEGELTTPGAMPPELTNEEAGEQWENGKQWHGGDIISGQNRRTGICWYVPLDRLQDIATVTIIGNPDRKTLKAAKERSTKKGKDYWNVTRMTQRLDYLKELARQEDGSIRHI